MLAQVCCSSIHKSLISVLHSVVATIIGTCSHDLYTIFTNNKFHSSVVVAPTDHKVTYGKTALMTCVGLIGLTTQNAAFIVTSINWMNPNGQSLTNSSDNSVSVYIRSLTQGGRVFMESILKICNFSHADEGSYSCQV